MMSTAEILPFPNNWLNCLLYIWYVNTTILKSEKFQIPESVWSQRFWIRDCVPVTKIVFAPLYWNRKIHDIILCIIHNIIFTYYLLIHLFIYSFIHSFICSFIHSLTHSFILHSFIHSFICSFIHSFIHSFIDIHLHMYMDYTIILLLIYMYFYLDIKLFLQHKLNILLG